MNQLAYFDCIGGASGDMLLGALLDAGLPLERLRTDLEALHLHGFDLRVRTVHKNGFRARKVDVIVHDQHTERQLPEIARLIRNSDLPPDLQNRALEIFQRMGAAEAHIHGLPVERVHLHELGGLDTIVDVVGVLAGLQALGVQEIHAAPLPLGRGMTQGAHGHIPLPAPATLALLQGLPIRGSATPGETVTPTGAALLSTLVQHWGDLPAMRLERIGYGAGARDSAIPNLVRLLLGSRAQGHSTQQQTIVRLSTDVDDASPEALGFAQELLLDAGALDVSFLPLFMKKNRPATRLEVLCRPQDAARLEGLLFAHTTTLGVRVETITRHALPREIRRVPTPWGEIRLKIAHLPDGAQRAAPEYEDCRQAAQQHGVALQQVYQAALQAWEG